MTPSASMVRGRRSTWTPALIIDALRTYADLHGEAAMTTAAFNPSLGAWRDRPDLVEVYVAGNPRTGQPWPSVNAIKKTFGSFNAARVAAGFEPNRTGPRPGAVRRPDGHGPDRETRHVVRTVVRTVVRDAAPGPDLAPALAKAVARAKRAEEALAASRAAKAKTITKTVRVPDERRVESLRRRWEGNLARVQAKLDAAVAERGVLRDDLAEARKAAARAGVKAARLEVALESARSETADAVALARSETLAADVARRELAEALAAAEEARSRTRVVVKDAPAQGAVDAALADARRDRGVAHAAEVRAAAAERAYAELAAATTGEERKLTRGEMNALRAKGPAGPAVLAVALKDLAVARRVSNPALLEQALGRIAAAAVSWRETIS